MASDILFPFWEILVNTIFGSVALSIVGVGVIMLLILFLTRTSWNFILFYMSFYVLVMTTLYLGALGLVLMFIVVFVYFIIALLRFAVGTYLNI